MLVFVIKELRVKKNITLYQLSKKTGLSRTYLRDLENNQKCNPTFAAIKKISDALEVNIKDLFYSELDLAYLQKEMYHRIDTFGLDSTQVLEISQIIDLLINIKMNED